jgi:hypothetical protein
MRVDFAVGLQHRQAMYSRTNDDEIEGLHICVYIGCWPTANLGRNVYVLRSSRRL